MAFIFVPNADGSFTEGDKQTNPDTGIEYAYIDGAWRALGPKIEDEFDTLDERYATLNYVDDAISAIPNPDMTEYFKKSGGTLTGSVSFNRGDKTGPQYKISPNSGTDYATNIYSLGNGQMRFRTSHTANESDNIGSHIVLDPNDGTPSTKIYKVLTPTSNDMAAPKSYIDNHKAKCRTGTTTNPSLTTGELFFNTATQQLFIGD